MQLVDEEHRAMPELTRLARFRDHFSKVGDACCHRAHRDHAGAADLREKAGQSGLAAAGRAPEHEARKPAAFGEPAQYLNDVPLPHELIESSGPEAAG